MQNDPFLNRNGSFLFIYRFIWFMIKSYEILCGIVEILRDDDTEDPECFMRIDRMISLLNSHDIDTGARHDFG